MKYSSKEMIGGCVKDDHQEGISRVLQRKGDMMKGQGGKMGMKGAKESHFERRGDNLTPRRA